MTRKQNIALATRYVQLAAIAGNAFHIDNAKDHLTVAKESNDYDADATRHGMKAVFALIITEV